MTLNSNLRGLNNEILVSSIESTVSPLIITDNQQNDNPIVYANQAFLDLCGYDESEIVGRNCRFLQGADSDKKIIAQIKQAVIKERNIRVKLKNYKKDGTAFWNDLVVSPVKNDQGVTTHFIGMQLDITKSVEHTDKLERTQRKLLLANQELEQFTYAASHDLQEPLRMVSSYLQLLEKRYGASFEPDAQTFINFAAEGAERMQALINDLLTLSRVSSTGKRFKQIDFQEIIARATFNLKLLIEETKTKLTVGDLPSMEVDSVQLVQLFQNLIGNAIKYRRPDNTPDITITAERQGSDYVFSIADNGIGIDKQYFERIFTIFQRLHTREEYPGTGVGLAICSKIVDRHGGRIWVESNKRGGSTFKFSLPAKRKVAE